MAMISTPAKGCAVSIFASSASAGGQLEQPSDVKSSTTTGTAVVDTGCDRGPPLCTGKGRSAASRIGRRDAKASFIGNAPKRLAYDVPPTKKCQTRSTEQATRS